MYTLFPVIPSPWLTFGNLLGISPHACPLRVGLWHTVALEAPSQMELAPARPRMKRWHLREEETSRLSCQIISKNARIFLNKQFIERTNNYQYNYMFTLGPYH